MPRADVKIPKRLGSGILKERGIRELPSKKIISSAPVASSKLRLCFPTLALARCHLQPGTTAVTSISTLARSSISAATCTADIATS